MGLRWINRKREIPRVPCAESIAGMLWCLFFTTQFAHHVPAAPLLGLPGNHRVVGNIKADFYDRSPDGRFLCSHEAFLEAWYFDELQARIVLITSGENKELGYFSRDHEPRLWVRHQGPGFYFSMAKRTRLNDGMFQAVSPYFHILFMKELLDDDSISRKEEADALDPGRRQVAFSAELQGTRRNFLLRTKGGLLEQLEESFNLPGAGPTFSRTIIYADYDARYPAFPRFILTEFWAPYPKSLYPKPIPWIKIACAVQKIEDILPPDDALPFARSLAEGFEEVLGDDVAASARAVVLQNIRETEPLQMKRAKPIPPGAKIAPLSQNEFGGQAAPVPTQGRATFSTTAFLAAAGAAFIVIGIILAALRKPR